jgi:ElaA protein
MKYFDELNNSELYKILKVRNEIFVVEQNCVYQDCDGKDQWAYHLYFEENGEIIAYLRILEKGISYDEISIGRVLVKENQRKKSLARKLMLKAIDFIESSLNETSIRISAQQYLVEFYKSLGFSAVSEMYLEDDIPHQEMLYSK